MTDVEEPRQVDVLLIGGGVAAASAAAELRERGFEGSIVLACRELDAPYHRPPVTKRFLQGLQDRAATMVHPPDWYADHDIELLTRTSVAALDCEARTAKLGREEVRYGQALLATGAMVRRLDVDGAHADGVYYLRALSNADALREGTADAERIVIIGGSYIATEVAASLTTLGKRCTLLMQEDEPLERSFGTAAGRFVRALLEQHDVEIVHGQTVTALETDGGEDDATVRAVLTDDGRRFPADAVVVGVGAVPDVMLAKRAGLDLGDSGGVACDAQLRTSADGLYAAGDVCEYDSALHGRRVRIEHEDVAIAQGRTAARNMLGAGERFEEIPYFWSDLADWTTMEYIGAADAWDEELVRGDPSTGCFSVWYLSGGRLVANLAVGCPDDLDAGRALLGHDVTEQRMHLTDSSADLRALHAERAHDARTSHDH